MNMEVKGTILIASYRITLKDRFTGVFVALQEEAIHNNPIHHLFIETAALPADVTLYEGNQLQIFKPKRVVFSSEDSGSIQLQDQGHDHWYWVKKSDQLIVRSTEDSSNNNSLLTLCDISSVLYAQIEVSLISCRVIQVNLLGWVDLELETGPYRKARLLVSQCQSDIYDSLINDFISYQSCNSKINVHRVIIIQWRSQVNFYGFTIRSHIQVIQHEKASIVNQNNRANPLRFLRNKCFVFTAWFSEFVDLIKKIWKSDSPFPFAKAIASKLCTNFNFDCNRDVTQEFIDPLFIELNNGRACQDNDYLLSKLPQLTTISELDNINLENMLYVVRQSASIAAVDDYLGLTIHPKSFALPSHYPELIAPSMLIGQLKSDKDKGISSSYLISVNFDDSAQKLLIAKHATIHFFCGQTQFITSRTGEEAFQLLADCLLIDSVLVIVNQYHIYSENLPFSRHWSLQLNDEKSSCCRCIFAYQEIFLFPKTLPTKSLSYSNNHHFHFSPYFHQYTDIRQALINFSLHVVTSNSNIMKISNLRGIVVRKKLLVEAFKQAPSVLFFRSQTESSSFSGRKRSLHSDTLFSDMSTPPMLISSQKHQDHYNLKVCLFLKDIETSDILKVYMNRKDTEEFPLGSVVFFSTITLTISKNTKLYGKVDDRQLLTGLDFLDSFHILYLMRISVFFFFFFLFIYL
jgi:hypothetical protein